MNQDQSSVFDIYRQGIDALKSRNVEWGPWPQPEIGVAARANRDILNSMFFVPRFLGITDPRTDTSVIGIKIETPVFCSAISKRPYMEDSDLVEIAQGVKAAGSFMMLGIGGPQVLQMAIDTGAPVVKMVKPYRNTDLVYEKVRDAESRGCVAVGMDIDHSLGLLQRDVVRMTDTFGPQRVEELSQLVSETKLPFVIKGVLSRDDADGSVQMGASAIVVSNHGSASLDSGVPSMAALPQIAEGFSSSAEVLADTGFQRGNDVFKAIACGAKAVGFAGSLLLAQAAGGADGVRLLISLITQELRRTMAATGCRGIDDIGASKIVRL